MNSKERRKEILNTFRVRKSPVSGGSLSAQFGVSRQIIVQDVALLRAEGHDIISTNRGYLLKESARVTRTFHVHHTDDQIEEELNAIVDMGGTVLDVFVIHEVYGRIQADLSISSRKQVRQFMKELESGKSGPLKKITNDTHFHTVEADSEEILNDIQDILQEKGFLLDEEL